MISTTSSSSLLDSTLLKKKTSRTLPLRLKVSDPSQCLDIIDDMYEIYLKQQVFKFIYFIQTNVILIEVYLF